MSQKALNEDLNIISGSNLEITVDPFTANLNIIQQLDDEPNDVGGLTANQLKATFDKAGLLIQKYINETLVPEVLSEGITEANRQIQEAQRQTGESQRQDNESQRQSAETARAAAESLRQSNESSRQAAEAARQTAQTRFMNGVTATAEQLPFTALPTVQAVVQDGSFRLEFGIPKGETGPQGAQGIQGNTGAQGPMGAQGGVGPQGPRGQKGDTGDAGPRGPAGPQGDAGPKGDPGPRGLQGPQGVSGVAVAADGIYAFNVDENGHLLCSYTGDGEPDIFIDSSGHLILNLEAGTPAIRVKDGSGGETSLPAGIIVVWSGAADNIPAGWHLCDGTDGTPDLRDKFVLGTGTAHAVGDTGGEEEVTLTSSQMPKHSHNIYYTGTSSNIKHMALDTTKSLVKQSLNASDMISFSGQGKPHNNMPPYYALAYIMKL